MTLQRRRAGRYRSQAKRAGRTLQGVDELSGGTAFACVDESVRSPADA